MVLELRVLCHDPRDDLPCHIGLFLFQDAYVTFGNVAVDRLHEPLFDFLLLHCDATDQAHHSHDN